MRATSTLPDHPRHDVRMDGVYFERAAARGAFARTLEAGNYSYCVMLRSGRMRLETDFPVPATVELGPGDAVAVSGLAPHVFRAVGQAPAEATGVFERRPMTENWAEPADVELILGVAPNESLALGSLMVGPIVVLAREHPDLSQRLWMCVEMLEDEYRDTSWIDRNLVVRRVAELMMINMSRRLFADHRDTDADGARSPASRPIMQAINAFFRAPGQAWTLAELARAAGMSRTRFAEEFKAVTGHSPGRIIARMRLTAVAQRLASAPLSVEAAAEEAGYSSSAAFVRAFQRAFGETPARWRRRRSVRDETPARGRPQPSPRRTTPTVAKAARLGKDAS